MLISHPGRLPGSRGVFARGQRRGVGRPCPPGLRHFGL